MPFPEIVLLQTQVLGERRSPLRSAFFCVSARVLCVAYPTLHCAPFNNNDVVVQICSQGTKYSYCRVRCLFA